MFFLPTMSEADDQMNRPDMLPRDSSATNPAAAVAVTGWTVPRKKSWIMGDAVSRIPMPAVTFMHSTIQSSQNCGVLTALLADTFAVVTNFALTLLEGS